MFNSLLEDVEVNLERAIEWKQKGRSHQPFGFCKYTIGTNLSPFVISIHDNGMPVGMSKMHVDEAICYLQGQKDLIMFLIATKQGITINV